MSAPRKRQKNGKGGTRGGRRRTSFKPGNQAAKGHGRPPLPADYKMAMEDRLGPKGLAALEAILDNPDHPRHEQCAEYVVNRWKGTPTVKSEIAGPGGGPIPVKAVRTSDEKRKRLEAILAAAVARVKAAGEGDPDAAAGSD